MSFYGVALVITVTVGFSGADGFPILGAGVGIALVITVTVSISGANCFPVLGAGVAGVWATILHGWVTFLCPPGGFCFLAHAGSFLYYLVWIVTSLLLAYEHSLAQTYRAVQGSFKGCNVVYSELASITSFDTHTLNSSENSHFQA